MTYYADLTPFTYIEDRGPSILNVGWLESDQPYLRGEVSADDIAAIERLILNGWQPEFSRGWHDCSLCGKQAGEDPIMRTIQGQEKLLGAANLFAPAGETMYVAPSLIVHYIEAHGYAPPEGFLEAVRAIDPSSPAYRLDCERIWKAGAPL